MRGYNFYTNDDLEALVCHLSDGKWRKSDLITKEIGVNARKIRSIAEHTGRFISGDLGYKLTEHATDEEVKRHLASLRSRASKIKRRIKIVEQLTGVE